MKKPYFVLIAVGIALSVSSFAAGQQSKPLSDEQIAATFIAVMGTHESQAEHMSLIKSEYIRTRKSPKPKEVTQAMMDSYDNLNKDYQKAIKSPLLYNAVLASISSEYMTDAASATTTYQMSNASEKAIIRYLMLQAHQNQRIIVLLEKQNAAK